MDKKLIYLDNNATTPCDPRVVEAMLPYFYQHPGNASSRNHPFGWAAEEAVDYAREQIANLISADPKEIMKKEVRGLLKKRAKKYDSDNSESEEENDKQKK